MVDFHKTLRDATADLAKRHGISVDKAFSVWYGVEAFA